jgi:hypothetical protein
MTGMTCECGADCAPGLDTCHRCAWLDGRTEAEARVIAAIRTIGQEVTRDALRHETGMPERTLTRTLDKLRQLRRIVVEHYRDEDNRERATYRLRTSRLGA